MSGQPAKLLNLVANLIGAARERHRFQHRLQSITLALLHLLQFFRVRQIRRGLSGKVLSPFQAFFEPAGAVFKRTAHGVRAGREPSLIERHQETDRAGARVLPSAAARAHSRFTKRVTSR